MKKNFGFLAFGAAVMLGLMLGSSPANAAIFTFGDYTIIEADPFADGGTAGNTTAVGGGFYSAAADSDLVWRDRTVGAFGTGYEGLSGATDRVYQSATPNVGPELVTTVSGLTAGWYEVSVVYLYSVGSDTQAGLLANLTGVTDDSDPTHFYDRTEIDVSDIGGAGSASWAVGLATIGTTSSGATGFTVNIDERLEPVDGEPYDRATYIGVAYRVIPEPSSFVLLGISAVGLLLRRRQ